LEHVGVKILGWLRLNLEGLFDLLVTELLLLYLGLFLVLLVNLLKFLLLMLVHVEVLDFFGSHEQHVGLSLLFVLITVLLLHLFDLILLLLSQGLLLSLGLLLLLLLLPSFGLSSFLLLLVSLICLLRLDGRLQVLLSVVDELGLLEGGATETLVHD